MPFHLKRFETSLDAHVDPKTREAVLAGSDEYDTLKTPRQKAAWIKGLVERLEDEVGSRLAGQVMEGCGRGCIGASTLKKAQQIKQSAGDLDDLLDRLNQAHIGGGKLRREGEVIHASYERCYCGSVNQAREPLSSTYCRCSCGWYRQLFETLLQEPVEVELLSSIAQGAESCQFIIRQSDQGKE